MCRNKEVSNTFSEVKTPVLYSICWLKTGVGPEYFMYMYVAI